MKWKGECVCSCIRKHKAQEEGLRAADGWKALSARQSKLQLFRCILHLSNCQITEFILQEKGYKIVDRWVLKEHLQ